MGAVSEKANVSIVALDSSLLATPLPALRLAGPTDAVITALARRAGLIAERTGADSWRLTRPPPPARPREPVVRPRATVPTVIVQASKRPELLGDYPAEIVRVSGADVSPYGGVPDTGALQQVAPILTSTDWGAGQEKLFLRGIADSSFGSASPALVGEYLGDQPLIYDAPDPNLRLYDVSSVEVLAGPQGTLYGAGALAGLIRIEPTAPQFDRTSGSMWAGASAMAHGAPGADVGGVLNLPLVDGRLALRLVGYAANDGGYIDDAERGLKDVNESLTRGGRVALRWSPAEDWKIDFGGVIQRIANRDASYVMVGDPALTRSSGLAQPSTDTFAAGDITVMGRVGGIDIRSTTGFVDQVLRQRFEALRPGGVPSQFDQDDRPQHVSQELRLSGGTSVTSWVVGLSYLTQWEAMTRDFGGVEMTPQIASLHERTDDVRAYAEASRKLFGRLSAAVGVSYAEESEGGAVVDDERPYQLLRAGAVVGVADREGHVLPSVALSYQLRQGTNLFVRQGSGVRPGGLTPAATDTHYASDRLTTTEVGLRSGSAGRDQIALSATGAYSRWRNIQADVLDDFGLPQTENIGDGDIYSLDASFAVRLSLGLTVSASGFLTRSRLDESPVLSLTGPADSLPDVARNGGLLSLDERGGWSNGWAWQAGVHVQHIGPSLLGFEPVNRVQGAATTVAMGAALRLGSTSLLMNVTNLLDARNTVFAIGAPFVILGEDDVTPLRPRTLRLGLHYDF